MPGILGIIASEYTPGGPPPTTGPINGLLLALSTLAYTAPPTIHTAPTFTLGTPIDNTQTVTKPAGAGTGDYYVVDVYTETAALPTLAIFGFTAGPIGGATGSNNMWIRTFYRLYDGTESATFTVTGTTSYTSLLPYVIHGASTPSPSAVSTVTSGATVSAPGTTTTVDHSLVVIRYAEFSGGAGVALTAPSGATHIGAWFGNSQALDTIVIAAPAAIGTVVHNVDSGSTASLSYTVWPPA